MEWDHIEHSAKWYGDSLQKFRTKAIERGDNHLFGGLRSASTDDTAVPYHFGESHHHSQTAHIVKWPRYIVALGGLSCTFVGVSWVLALVLNKTL